MDTLQIILIVVVVALTTLLIIVGVQVVLIIVDLRRALKRVNSMLEDGIWGGGLLRPEKLTGIIEMFRKKKTLVQRDTSHTPNSEDKMKEI